MIVAYGLHIRILLWEGNKAVRDGEAQTDLVLTLFRFLQVNESSELCLISLLFLSYDLILIE